MDKKINRAFNSLESSNVSKSAITTLREFINQQIETIESLKNCVNCSIDLSKQNKKCIDCTLSNFNIMPANIDNWQPIK